MSEEWPIAGSLLASRYRLAELLEIGGMSQIWRADDELLARPVAVKLPLGAQVVWREARMAAKLQHPNIAAVHDYREAVRPDGSVTPFVVMELLAGESVAARLEREPIGLPEAARIGAAVADALAAAHASGVVHRDIKPGNVMLTPTGVKILDFGISATAGEPDDDESGSTFGTPAYVAPERLDGMPSEPATDVYGLGVLLFEMVTGDPPYPVDTWEELAEARAGGGPAHLPADLPQEFRDLVARCLDDSPEARPTAAEVRFDLTALWLKPEPAQLGPALSSFGPALSSFGPAPSNSSADPSSFGPATSSNGTAQAATSSNETAQHESAAASASGGRFTPLAAAGPPSSSTPPENLGPAARYGRFAPDRKAGPSAGFKPGRAVPASRAPHTERGVTAGHGFSARQGFSAGHGFSAEGASAGHGFSARQDPRAGRELRGGRMAATGRAPANTLALTKPPGRRLALIVGVTALVAALVGSFAVINWPRNETTDANPELPAPPAAVTTTPETVAPTTTTPPPTSFSPTPKPSPTLSFDDAVSRFRTAVERGAAGGDIRSDVATDLLNLLQPLTRNGDNAGDQVDALRRKINDRAGEGSVSSAQAALLRSRLADVDKAARTL
ncbi:serine/threonine-protein kinase [Paractinoplanes atraurantiacus]|uniref:non-specific serine/threonine protein kinase n=1 Tax=Paractinoplanes atraurantiacus TaxID=1036182 RepID=A0A285KGV0_9ACTN|nr:serine/threonine-protein kinase [Actinoplanes atraurantiacus]SNY71852.1 Serine/threonine protein kinase [Actinoplanes atraurantiacus]